jgi:transposase-like protein
MSKKTTDKPVDQEKIVGIFSGLNPESIQDLFEARARQAALALGVELLEQDVERLCGARYSRSGECSRYGKEQTSIQIGGARYGFERPRIRGEEGEVYPPTLKKLRGQDLLDEEMKQRMLLGVSTRNYEKVIEGYSKKVGVSKSSVSRAFKRASKKDLDAINQGDLSEHTFVALAIDGLEIAGRTVIAALGITDGLEKLPLGLLEGDTENSEVVTDLLSTLRERGFSLHCEKILCLLDGSKALKKAVISVFGSRALIQRCWLHKLRNIQSYIPKSYHETLVWRMRKLMGLNAYKEAQMEYRSLRKWLEGISHSAANSLDEAGEELLTLHKLGITGELRKSLSSTNIIESLFSVVRAKLQNVKNWKSRKTVQTLRWVAAAILQHKKNKMRKLRGMNQRTKLIQALGVKLDQKQISA